MVVCVANFAHPFVCANFGWITHTQFVRSSGSNNPGNSSSSTTSTSSTAIISNALLFNRVMNGADTDQTHECAHMCFCGVDGRAVVGDDGCAVCAWRTMRCTCVRTEMTLIRSMVINTECKRSRFLSLSSDIACMRAF